MFWDLTGFFWLNSYAGLNQNWDYFFVFISDKLLYLSVLIILIAFLVWKRPLNFKFKVFSIFALANLLALGLIVFVFNEIWPRPRPFESLDQVRQLVEETGFSFPSRHATISFLLSVFVFKYNKKLSFLILFFAILVSLGRIFVGVHYPADVLAGAILGLVIGLIFTRNGFVDSTKI